MMIPEEYQNIHIKSDFYIQNYPLKYDTPMFLICYNEKLTALNRYLAPLHSLILQEPNNSLITSLSLFSFKTLINYRLSTAQLAISGHESGDLNIWDISNKSQSLYKVPKAHNSRITQIIQINTQRIATLGPDNAIKIWDLEFSDKYYNIQSGIYIYIRFHLPPSKTQIPNKLNSAYNLLFGTEQHLLFQSHSQFHIWEYTAQVDSPTNITLFMKDTVTGLLLNCPSYWKPNREVIIYRNEKIFQGISIVNNIDGRAEIKYKFKGRFDLPEEVILYIEEYEYFHAVLQTKHYLLLTIENSMIILRNKKLFKIVDFISLDGRLGFLRSIGEELILIGQSGGNSINRISLMDLNTMTIYSIWKPDGDSFYEEFIGGIFPY